MLITDLVLAIVFTVGLATALFLNEGKIKDWADSTEEEIRW